MMNNNLHIIRGGYSYCTCTYRESQIMPAVLRINIHKNLASLRVHLGFPHSLGDSPTCSQTFHKSSHSSPVPVIRDPSYSEGWPDCLSRVWYSPDIDDSQFTLHILSETPGVSQELKYILLMKKACEVFCNLQETEIMIPLWIDDYNHNMGAVDVAD